MSKIKLKIISALFIILVILILLNMPLKPVYISGKIIFVEVADSLNKRSQGLKGRKSLPENQGMLFCFEKEGYPQFWMKDTLIPLDIAFIDKDKQIVDVQHMAALDDKSRYVPKNKAIYALEMNTGWFGRHRIGVGARLFFK